MKKETEKENSTEAKEEGTQRMCVICCKNKAFAFVAVIILLIIAGVYAAINCCCNKIAIVNLQQVVSQSSQVLTLKNNNYNKSAELSNWLQNAQKEVDNEKDAKKKEELLKKYNAEFSDKKNILNNEYAKELKVIDANISSLIKDFAQKKGYKMVITNTNVLYGGEDITNDIVELVK